MESTINTAEVTLSGGRKAKIKGLNALELIQATSFAGADPNAQVINLCTAVCAVCELDGVEQKPLGSRAQFLALAGNLQSTDTVLIGLVQQKMAMAGVTEEQKKELAALLGLEAESDGKSDDSSPS